MTAATRVFRVVETVRYEVEAATEEEADRIFREHVACDCEPPVRYVGVDDRDVIEIVNAHGKRVVVAPR
jgi:hypothetical protein